MTTGQERPQQDNVQENYESKFNEVEEGINNLLNDNVDDNDAAKGKIDGALNTGFSDWLRDNPDKAQILKPLIEKFIEEINKPDSKLKKEDFASLLNFARDVLGIDIDVPASPDVASSNLPEISLNGTFPEVDSNGNTKTLYGLVRDEPTLQDGAQDTTPEGQRFYDAVKKVENQLTEIGTLLENSLLANNDNLKSLKDLLEKFKVVMNNTTLTNVKILQKYIYENLEGEEKSLFGSKNHQSTGFDGKFGEYTLNGLNSFLGKTGKHIEDLKKWVESQTTQPTPDGQGEGSGEGDGAGTSDQGDLNHDGGGSGTDQGAQVSPDGVTNPADTSPLTFGGNNYGVMQNSPSLSDNVGVGATFYSTEAMSGQQTVDGQNTFVEVPSGEYECYVRLSDRPDNLYRVRVDSLGNLCPIAKEIDTTISGKDGNYVETNVLLKNNGSCINYLKNKLPSGLDCEISWNAKKEDYQIVSYGGDKNYVTIEPMTIGGAWVSQDLTECLALLNFINYLTSGINKNYKGKDPDLKWKKDSLYVETNDGRRELSSDFLNGLGLGNVSKEVWKRFIDYNNKEAWLRGSDDLKENQYTKIDFPSVTLQQGGGTGAVDQGGQTVQPTSDGQGEGSGDGAGDQGDGNHVDQGGQTVQPTSDGQGEGSGDGVGNQPDGNHVDQGGGEHVDEGNDVVEGGNIIDITALLRFNSESYKFYRNDFDAMQSFLGSDKQFIELKDGKVICDLGKVRSYLESIKDNDWSYFKSLKGGEKTAWITAVQILLNEWHEANGMSQIAITGRLYDGPYKNDTVAYSTRGHIIGFQYDNGLGKDGKPGRDTISKLLECTGSLQHTQDHVDEGGQTTQPTPDGTGTGSGTGTVDQPDGTGAAGDGDGEHVDEGHEGDEGTLNEKIKEGIDKMNIQSPILDLSELTTLTESDVKQIFEGIGRKIGDTKLSVPPTIRLDGLTSLDKSVAGKLSDWKGGITINGIINGIDFNNCESVIELLNTLAPDGKEVKIIVFDATIGDKLKSKGVNNIEVYTSK